MARLLQAGQPVLNIINGNFTLAHLQCAAFEQFRSGDGFMLTLLGGRDDDGRPLGPKALWCPRETALHFEYDEGEPVEIRQDLVDVFKEAMQDPVGVIIGSDGGNETPPFLLPAGRWQITAEPAES